MIIDDLNKLINGNKDIILFHYQTYFFNKKSSKNEKKLSNKNLLNRKKILILHPQ